MVTSSKNTSLSLQVGVGVETTGRVRKEASVGTLAGREGDGDTEIFPPQADKMSHKYMKTLAHAASEVVHKGLHFLPFFVSFSSFLRIADESSFF